MQKLKAESPRLPAHQAAELPNIAGKTVSLDSNRFPWLLERRQPTRIC
jgi:hypothetical protein